MSAVLDVEATVGATSVATVPRAVIATEVAPAKASGAPTIAVVLLGTGVVGGALLKLLNTPAAASLRLVGAANSRRQQTDPVSLASRSLREQLNHQGDARDNAGLLAALDAGGAAVRVIVDATASAPLASRHAEWLARGYHVVTANKALAGGELTGWRALQAALAHGGCYGDAATVGAGLPVLSTLRRLRSCGDSLLTLEGVFSGSLSWLFNQYDGSRPFSALLREARQLGYTEPDPRSDLSGEDVARKLLIIARSAGFSLGTDEVDVQGLVPEALRALDTESFLARLEELDEPLAKLHADAKSRGCVLRFLARLNQRGRARVGLVEVPLTHPAARLYGTDNQFALTTTRYNTQPLVIQGPGAGPEVTAQALLGDVLALV
ncbi:homoserine dehydrogenase [Rhodanobacter glycinis]|uniref:Homoserine dehydrogenase n=1 Tax=Rhodanobacter glycinis TaxID=582702 RepID=A0A502CEN7_9GAMM|nr:homoserine dehydrogenase [Rhodanobacter glycinis]TPG11243.1 homoserine dehydrogenase [Rhodanobacter glycinis]TPG48733.1 homoserine dehydrogenase [Rhodanobacter glycinis]